MKHPIVCMSVLLLLVPDFTAAAEKGAHVLTLREELLDSKEADHSSHFARGLRALQAKAYDQALELFEKAVVTTDMEQASAGWLTAQFHVCQTLNLLGRKAEAINRAHQVVRSCEESFGAEDVLTSEGLAHLASQLKHSGRLAEAEAVYLRNLNVLEKKHGESSYFAACARTRLANLLMSLGRLDEAEVLHRASLEDAQETLEADNADFSFFLSHLAFCLHVNNKKAEAAMLMNQAHEIIKAKGADALEYPGSTLRRQAEFFRDTRQLDKAKLAGRLCLERLSQKDEAARARFFYYDTVQQLYRSILVADGLSEKQINSHLADLEQQAGKGR